MYSGIIYDPTTSVILRLVVTDDLLSLSGHVQPGESLLLTDRDLLSADGLPDLAKMAEELVRGKWLL